MTDDTERAAWLQSLEKGSKIGCLKGHAGSTAKAAIVLKTTRTEIHVQILGYGSQTKFHRADGWEKPQRMRGFRIVDCPLDWDEQMVKAEAHIRRLKQQQLAAQVLQGSITDDQLQRIAAIVNE